MKTGHETRLFENGIPLDKDGFAEVSLISGSGICYCLNHCSYHLNLHVLFSNSSSPLVLSSLGSSELAEHVSIFLRSTDLFLGSDCSSRLGCQIQLTKELDGMVVSKVEEKPFEIP
jgi:hypothetical protein